MSVGMKEKIKYILPVLLTMVLGSIVLAVKKMFPFGNDTIDYYDMAQQIAAFYYHVYDMLHGEKAFFFDWYTALGVNMAMSTSGCSNLSPFNLFFLFVPRDMLLESLSIFNLLKMMCMTFTMYLFLHKTYRAPYFFKALLSTGYGFCGFVLVLYITNQWMDIAVLFPLILLSLGKLLREGTMRWYVVTMSLALINSYYLAFMILIFIFLMTGLFICAEYLFEKKEERTHYFLFRLGAGTLASAAVSAFIVIPQLLQTFVSARFENENSGGLLTQYLAILRQVTGAYTTRWWSLLGLSFAAALIVCGLVKFRKEKKTVFLVCSAVLMMVLELFFESVNLMWHFGSYIQYPIRNGFMIYTVIASCACYYAGRLFPKEERGLFCGKKKQILKAGAGLAVTAILAGIGIMLYRAHPGLQLRTVFHTTSIVMAAAFFLYLSFFVWKSGKYKYYSVFLLMAELIFYTFLLLGKPSFITGYSEEPEQEGEYIRICNQLAEDFSIEPDYLARVKNPDESLNANYGLILRRPALSNWTHLISPELQQGAGAWGYSWQFTRLLDAGGTAFSDALLGVTETISCLVQDPALYEKKASAEVVVDHTSGRQDTYTLYQNQYTLPWGLTAAQADMVSKWMGTDLADTDADIVSLQNSLYRALAKESGSGEIACWIKNGDDLNQNSAVSDEEKTDGLVNTETVIIQVQDMTALYFQGGGADREDKNTEIFVNGEPAAVPSIKETDNTLYPAHFNNNAICLGTFENEQVTVEIKTDLSVTDKSETQISALDIGKLGELCKSYQNYDTKVSAGKHSLSAQIYAEEDGEFLLLPLAYDDGWNVRVNQKTVQASSYAGIFTAIPLEKGDNEVTMTYLPKGMKQGLLLTAGTLLALFTAMLFRLKRPGVRKPEGSFMEPVYMAAWTAALLLIYIVPIVSGILFLVI